MWPANYIYIYREIERLLLQLATGNFVIGRNSILLIKRGAIFCSFDCDVTLESRPIPERMSLHWPPILKLVLIQRNSYKLASGGKRFCASAVLWFWRRVKVCSSKWLARPPKMLCCQHTHRGDVVCMHMFLLPKVALLVKSTTHPTRLEIGQVENFHCFHAKDFWHRIHTRNSSVECARCKI